jgi:catechol 2,3-dioxygenase-like lactoylglutathione lyase family enzyme
MAAKLNHTIVWCHDQETSATFLTEILGLPPPRRFMGFLVVDLANDVSVDYLPAESEPIALQHLAFLVSEDEFDGALARVHERTPQIWADPAKKQPGRINRHFGGRGVYFDDPNGHLLEIITTPYGDPAALEP